MPSWFRRPGGLAAAAIAGVLASALAASPASADIFTSILDVGNTDLGGFPGPYGTVTVNRTSSTTATVTFTAASSGQFQYSFIDSGIVDVNVNAASWTVGSFSGTPLNGNFQPFACANTGCDGGSGTVDGHGVFNQTVNAFDGYDHAQSSVSFVLTDTGGTWASAAQVLTANASGFDAAAHIAVCDTSRGTCDPSIGAAVTGFAAESGGTTVPEPGSLTLLGTGLILLGLIGAGFGSRRRWYS